MPDIFSQWQYNSVREEPVSLIILAGKSENGNGACKWRKIIGRDKN
jgi:hypothetical protein